MTTKKSDSEKLDAFTLGYNKARGEYRPQREAYKDKAATLERANTKLKRILIALVIIIIIAVLVAARFAM